LGSCDLSMTDTYAFTNVLYYTVNEESREDVVIDFFKTYIDFDESYSFTGSQYDAISFGQEQMEKNLTGITKESVEAILEEGEAVEYVMYMTGSKFKGPIGTVSWSKGTSEEEDEG